MTMALNMNGMQSQRTSWDGDKAIGEPNSLILNSNYKKCIKCIGGSDASCIYHIIGGWFFIIHFHWIPPPAEWGLSSSRVSLSCLLACGLWRRDNGDEGNKQRGCWIVWIMQRFWTSILNKIFIMTWKPFYIKFIIIPWQAQVEFFNDWTTDAKYAAFQWAFFNCSVAASVFEMCLCPCEYDGLSALSEMSARSKDRIWVTCCVGWVELDVNTRITGHSTTN